MFWLVKPCSSSLDCMKTCSYHAVQQPVSMHMDGMPEACCRTAESAGTAHAFSRCLVTVMCTLPPLVQVLGARSKQLNFPRLNAPFTLSTCKGCVDPVESLLSGADALVALQQEMQAASGSLALLLCCMGSSGRCEPCLSSDTF
jgi:hypothetical protein